MRANLAQPWQACGEVFDLVEAMLNDAEPRLLEKGYNDSELAALVCR